MTEIPKFKSEDEEMDFWSAHSALEFIDQGEEVQVDASRARDSREKRRAQQISLRMSENVLERTKRRARMLGVPYQTLMQLWIAERLEKEEAGVLALRGESGKRKPRVRAHDPSR